MADVLIVKGADPNKADKDKWTILHWAAQQGHLPVFELLEQAVEKLAGLESALVLAVAPRAMTEAPKGVPPPLASAESTPLDPTGVLAGVPARLLASPGALRPRARQAWELRALAGPTSGRASRLFFSGVPANAAAKRAPELIKGAMSSAPVSKITILFPAPASWLRNSLSSRNKRQGASCARFSFTSTTKATRQRRQ